MIVACVITALVAFCVGFTCGWVIAIAHAVDRLVDTGSRPMQGTLMKMPSDDVPGTVAIGYWKEGQCATLIEAAGVRRRAYLIDDRLPA